MTLNCDWHLLGESKLNVMEIVTKGSLVREPGSNSNCFMFTFSSRPTKRERLTYSFSYVNVSFSFSTGKIQLVPGIGFLP